MVPMSVGVSMMSLVPILALTAGCEIATVTMDGGENSPDGGESESDPFEGGIIVETYPRGVQGKFRFDSVSGNDPNRVPECSWMTIQESRWDAHGEDGRWGRAWQVTTWTGPNNISWGTGVLSWVTRGDSLLWGGGSHREWEYQVRGDTLEMTSHRNIFLGWLDQPAFARWIYQRRPKNTDFNARAVADSVLRCARDLGISP